MTKAPLLEVNLCAGYRAHTVLADLTFCLEHGERLGLVGVSGAGKSTLLLAILGLLSGKNGWLRGSVKLEQQELTIMSQSRLRIIRGRYIALIPQSPAGALSPVLSLAAHFREAWRAHEEGDQARMKLRIEEVLSSVRMPAHRDFMRRRATEISVGQAQRVLIALAILHRPKLIIADEPTSALDPVSRMEILNLLAELTGPGKASLLYVSHDILSVLRLCGRIAVLEKGQITEILSSAEIARSQSQTAKQLLAALPVPLELLLEHWARSPLESRKPCPAIK